jgi:hypothetical protein
VRLFDNSVQPAFTAPLQHLVVDNVAEAYPTLVPGGRRLDSLSNLAPPFPVFAVSFRTPSWKLQSNFSETCFVVEYERPSRVPGFDQYSAAYQDGWILRGYARMSWQGQVFQPDVYPSLLISREGHADGWLLLDKNTAQPVGKDHRDSYGNSTAELMKDLFSVVLLGIQLWNSPRTDRRIVDPPGQLVKKHLKKRGLQLRSHHVIVWNPFDVSEIIRRGSVGPRSPQMHHERKGHWRWQPIGHRLPSGHEGPRNAKWKFVRSHERGDIRLGTTSKTYEVRPTGTSS